MFNNLNIFSYRSNDNTSPELLSSQETNLVTNDNIDLDETSSILSKTISFITSSLFTNEEPLNAKFSKITACNLSTNGLYLDKNTPSPIPNEQLEETPTSSSSIQDSKPAGQTNKHNRSTKRRKRKKGNNSQSKPTIQPKPSDLTPMQTLDFSAVATKEKEQKIIKRSNPLGQKSGRIRPSSDLIGRTTLPKLGLKETNWALDISNHEKYERLPVITVNSNSGFRVLVQLSEEMIENLKGLRKAGDRHHISLNELNEFLNARGMSALKKAEKKPGTNIEMMAKVSLPGVNEEQILIFIFKKELHSKRNMVKLVTGYQGLLNRIARDRGVSETIMSHLLNDLKTIEIVNELEYIN